ncbi:hypothetical protein B0H14DRAFT_2576901 [Mycena olivaceomarginata]|nr:hypothetical protein B0H14DRAFT_2576901 [Mycena olivaceomarginata]
MERKQIVLALLHQCTDEDVEDYKRWLRTSSVFTEMMCVRMPLPLQEWPLTLPPIAASSPPVPTPDAVPSVPAAPIPTRRRRREEVDLKILSPSDDPVNSDFDFEDWKYKCVGDPDEEEHRSHQRDKIGRGHRSVQFTYLGLPIEKCYLATPNQLAAGAAK